LDFAISVFLAVNFNTHPFEGCMWGGGITISLFLLKSLHINFSFKSGKSE